MAYKFGRVIRIQEADVERFIEASRIAPGSLEHLYPEVKGATDAPTSPETGCRRPAGRDIWPLTACSAGS